MDLFFVLFTHLTDPPWELRVLGLNLESELDDSLYNNRVLFARILELPEACGCPE